MAKFDKYRNSNLEDLVVFNQDTGMYSLFLDEIGLSISPKMRVVSQFLNKAIKEKNLDIEALYDKYLPNHIRNCPSCNKPLAFRSNLMGRGYFCSTTCFSKYSWNDPDFRLYMLNSVNRQWEDPNFRGKMLKVQSENGIKNMAKMKKLYKKYGVRSDLEVVVLGFLKELGISDFVTDKVIKKPGQQRGCVAVLDFYFPKYKFNLEIDDFDHYYRKGKHEKDLDRDNILLNGFDIKVHRVHYNNVNLDYIKSVLKEVGII